MWGGGGLGHQSLVVSSLTSRGGGAWNRLPGCRQTEPLPGRIPPARTTAKAEERATAVGILSPSRRAGKRSVDTQRYPRESKKQKRRVQTTKQAARIENE